MYGQGGFNNPPVKVGEELEVEIEAVGEKGDGIAKKDGFVLFIPGVKEGDRVRIKVTKVLRKVGFADVVGEAGAAPSEDAPEEESQDEEAPAEEPSSEDSESFGEEEAPAEEMPEDEGIESTEEAPAEEPETEDLKKETE